MITDKLQELIDLHTQYMNPDYRNGHIVVAAGLITRTVSSQQEYELMCSEWGISSYMKLAKQCLPEYDMRSMEDIQPEIDDALFGG